MMEKEMQFLHGAGIAASFLSSTAEESSGALRGGGEENSLKSAQPHFLKRDYDVN